ncbi:MAG: hypothetical protein EKK57_07545 [Proteobacteria bacterium]|nr:MAG: hypothetical protein EKK57_07545 [Pseudomonadota bacterium]
MFVPSQKLILVSEFEPLEASKKYFVYSTVLGFKEPENYHYTNALIIPPFGKNSPKLMTFGEIKAYGNLHHIFNVMLVNPTILMLAMAYGDRTNEGFHYEVFFDNHNLNKQPSKSITPTLEEFFMGLR